MDLLSEVAELVWNREKMGLDSSDMNGVKPPSRGLPRNRSTAAKMAALHGCPLPTEGFLERPSSSRASAPTLALGSTSPYDPGEVASNGLPRTHSETSLGATDPSSSPSLKSLRQSIVTRLSKQPSLSGGGFAAAAPPLGSPASPGESKHKGRKQDSVTGGLQPPLSASVQLLPHSASGGPAAVTSVGALTSGLPSLPPISASSQPAALVGTTDHLNSMSRSNVATSASMADLGPPADCDAPDAAVEADSLQPNLEASQRGDFSGTEVLPRPRSDFRVDGDGTNPDLAVCSASPLAVTQGELQSSALHSTLTTGSAADILGQTAIDPFQPAGCKSPQITAEQAFAAAAAAATSSPLLIPPLASPRPCDDATNRCNNAQDSQDLGRVLAGPLAGHLPGLSLDLSGPVSGGHGLSLNLDSMLGIPHRGGGLLGSSQAAAGALRLGFGSSALQQIVLQPASTSGLSAQQVAGGEHPAPAGLAPILQQLQASLSAQPSLRQQQQQRQQQQASGLGHVSGGSNGFDLLGIASNGASFPGGAGPGLLDESVSRDRGGRVSRAPRGGGDTRPKAQASGGRNSSPGARLQVHRTGSTPKGIASWLLSDLRLYQEIKSICAPHIQHAKSVCTGSRFR